MKKISLIFCLLLLVLSLTSCQKNRELAQAIKKTNEETSMAIDMKIDMEMASTSVSMNMAMKVDGNITYSKMDLMGELIQIYTVVDEDNKSAQTYSYDGKKWLIEEIDYGEAIDSNFSFKGLNPNSFKYKDGKYVASEIELDKMLGSLGDLIGEDTEFTEISVEVELAEGMVSNILIKMNLEVENISMGYNIEMVFSQYVEVQLELPSANIEKK